MDVESIITWAIVVLLFIYAVNYKEKKNKKHMSAKLSLNKIIHKHLTKLILKWQQTVYQDDYGNNQYHSWNKEVDYFIRNVVLKDVEIQAYLKKCHTYEPDDFMFLIRTTINEMVQTRVSAKHVINHVEVDLLNGLEFEKYCSSKLSQNGWKCRVTQGSGDQGVDIIASRDNITVVFQCKRYEGNVGNSAVQEIISGKQFYNANYGVVVTNSTFTKSAKQLAASTQILLIHDSELITFYETYLAII